MAYDFTPISLPKDVIKTLENDRKYIEFLESQIRIAKSAMLDTTKIQEKVADLKKRIEGILVVYGTGK